MLGKTLPMIDCILAVNKSDTSYNYRHHPRQEQTLIPDFVHKKKRPAGGPLGRFSTCSNSAFFAALPQGVSAHGQHTQSHKPHCCGLRGMRGLGHHMRN